MGGVWVEGEGVVVGEGDNQEDQTGPWQNQEGLAGGARQGNGVPNSPLVLEDHNRPRLLAAGSWRVERESFSLEKIE